MRRAVFMHKGRAGSGEDKGPEHGAGVREGRVCRAWSHKEMPGIRVWQGIDCVLCVCDYGYSAAGSPRLYYVQAYADICPRTRACRRVVAPSGTGNWPPAMVLPIVPCPFASSIR